MDGGKAMSYFDYLHNLLGVDESKVKEIKATIPIAFEYTCEISHALKEGIHSGMYIFEMSHVL